MSKKTGWPFNSNPQAATALLGDLARWTGWLGVVVFVGVGVLQAGRALISTVSVGKCESVLAISAATRWAAHLIRTSTGRYALNSPSTLHVARTVQGLL